VVVDDADDTALDVTSCGVIGVAVSGSTGTFGLVPSVRGDALPLGATARGERGGGAFAHEKDAIATTPIATRIVRTVIHPGQSNGYAGVISYPTESSQNVKRALFIGGAGLVVTASTRWSPAIPAQFVCDKGSARGSRSHENPDAHRPASAP
jgi:hypothetical protein